jgi:hypothetical protein
MQHLRQIGFHARAFAGREDDDGKFSHFNCASSFVPRVKISPAQPVETLAGER